MQSKAIKTGGLGQTRLLSTLRFCSFFCLFGQLDTVAKVGYVASVCLKP